eukprot:2208592-Rhodomonas_salina.1
MSLHREKTFNRKFQSLGLKPRKESRDGVSSVCTRIDDARDVVGWDAVASGSSSDTGCSPTSGTSKTSSPTSTTSATAHRLQAERTLQSLLRANLELSSLAGPCSHGLCHPVQLQGALRQACGGATRRVRVRTSSEHCPETARSAPLRRGSAEPAPE